MNPDTQRSIKEILGNGYYRQGATLGDGGWPYLYTQGIGEWKTYQLYDGTGEIVEVITAKDDKTAIKAFSGLYHLDMLEGFSIVEKIVTFREIDTVSS